MKVTFPILLLALGAQSMPAAVVGTPAAKVRPDNALKVSSLDIQKNGTDLKLNLVLDASGLAIKSEREVIYTPMLVNGTDTVRFDSFIIAGRNRWLEHQRNDDAYALPLFRSGQIAEPIQLAEQTPYQEWMATSTLEMDSQECGCCAAPKGNAVTPIAEIDLVPKVFTPEMSYVTPKAEAVKTRSINARAYIDFPVNRTEIFPDYRRNPEELSKIRGTIDSVRNDRDLTITSIHIKGFASPEGTYANNERLAKGRTATLADYVRGLYHFDRNTITTSFQPEDWDGLIEYVKSDAALYTLRNRDAILALITDPAFYGRDDEREALLKKRFPDDYKYLLATIYPGLRHSDYAVNFNVRQYNDPQEIIAKMRTAPQNLSLNEFFVAANSVEPGSDIYNEAFDLAVRMYPEDETANLNAAFAAINRDDLQSAERYLAKAGTSEQAQYARAILTAKQGQAEEAARLLKGISNMKEAKDAETQIEGLIQGTRSSYRIINTTITPP